MSRPKSRVYASALALLAACLSSFQSAQGQAAPLPPAFAPETVGSTSATQTVTVPVRSAGTAASISLAPAAANEFQIVPGGTCAAGKLYAAGDTCTVAVAFAPVAPGAASAALLLRSTDGHTLGLARIRQTGLGAAAAFTPGLVEAIAVQSQSGQGFSALTSVADGTAYLAAASTGRVLRLDTQTGSTTLVATALPASGPVTALAADVDGTVFLAQANGTVTRVDGTGALTPIELAAIPADTSAVPTAMAVDPEGRLLLAFTNRVLRLEGGTWTLLAGSSACADPAAACGDGGDAAHATFNAIRAMAIDPAGNLLLADAAESRIRRVDVTSHLVTTVAGTGTACTHGNCGDNGPAASAALGTLSGLAVDPLGNLYIAEQGHGLRRIDAATHTISPVLPPSEMRFLSGPVQVAAQRDGGVLLLAQSDPATVARLTGGAAALTFAQTAVGQTSTDSVQTVTVSNLGNAPLTLATPAAGTNPSTTADFPLSNTQTCPQLSSSSAAQALAPGESCSLQVKFTPTSAGNVSGRVVLTESAAAAPLAHSIAVQGIAAAPTAQANIALVSLPTSLVYGQPLSLFVTVYSGSSGSPIPTGTVTFSEGSTIIAAGVSLSNGVATTTVTLPSTANHTYAVSYSGDSNYAPSAQNATVDVTVARAASVYTVSLPTYHWLQIIRTAFVLSGQYSGTGIALPTPAVNYTLLNSSGIVLIAGTTSFSFKVNSIDEDAPIGTLDPGTYTFRLSYPGDQNFLPLQQDYALVVQPAAPFIDFAPINSPVTYGTPPIPLSATGGVNVPPLTPTGLPVTFSVLSGPGTIVNDQLVVTGVGTIVVAADEAATSTFYAAPRVTQTVISVRPVAKLTWATPAPIITGTPLGTAQLNAAATGSNGQPLAGTYTYTPPAGTVLPVGNTTLNVSFVPSDTDHYGNVTLTASVILTVRDLNTPVLTFSGGTVPFGSSLAPVLNATATYNGAAVPGTFVYATAATPLTGATSLPVGSYTVTATFTPTDPNTYRSGSATATLAVTKGATAMSLVSSASPVLLNSSITLTAKVSGGTTMPTGMVQFVNGSTPLGSVAISSNGVAMLTFSTLPAGSQTITATYSGDANYTAASATLTEVVADFTLALAPNAANKQSVLRGKVATYQFTVAPTVTTALAGDVTFTLSGLPSGATYTVTPSTVASGSSTTGVTLAVTTAATLKSQVERSPWRGKTSMLAVALLLLPFGSRLRRGSTRMRRAGVLAAVLFASAMLLSVSGCGTGVGYFDQTQTTYPLTLSANSGSLSHTASVTLEVQ
ncbi:Ig-like domain repeat protein [Terriglobus sp.]|uniref:Ig-like domain repeat protein n=1 Tax=Terriglobus sp. TaxID=1889013 RepID=UPI003B005901